MRDAGSESGPIPHGGDGHTRGKAVATRCCLRSPPVDAVARMTAEGSRKVPAYRHSSWSDFRHFPVEGTAEADMLQRRGLLRVRHVAARRRGRRGGGRPAARAQGRGDPDRERAHRRHQRRRRARLDRELLLAWGPDELRTTTPFTDGSSTFSGVLASRLLDLLGADGTQLLTGALNDYAVAIPMRRCATIRSCSRSIATGSRCRCASAARSG